MAEELLGPAFEIHGGGLDLVFPHHENELAQSRALGHEFANIWMHNGMLRFTGEKMSKSLGNVETIDEVLDRWGRETALVFFLTAHWRSPIDFSDERWQQARRWATLSNAFASVGEPTSVGAWERLAAALEDDFNTPEALALMHECGARDLDLLRRALEVFGLEGLADAEVPGRACTRSPQHGRRHGRSETSPGRPAPRRRSRRPAGRCVTSRRLPARPAT